MAQIIGLPKLSPTMEEGVLVRWVKKEGDSVEPGDLVAEVETDKANMDFNLEDEGVLLKLLVSEGDTVRLGAPVAILGEKGEDVDALVAEARRRIEEIAGGKPPAPDAAEEREAASPPEKTDDAPRARKSDKADKADEPSAPARPARPEPAPERPTGNARGGARILASPLAKTLALDLGIDLRGLEGSGPGGRIVERDVRAAAEAEPEPEGRAGETERETERETDRDSDRATGQRATGDGASTALALVAPGPLSRPGQDDFVDRPVSGMRKTIATRLGEAKREIPHFRVTASFDAEPLMAFRERLNRLLGDEGKVSVNDLLMKGAALALRRVPEVNASYLGDAIRYYTRVHLGVAVALDRGLLTPVVRDADLKGIGVIGAEVRELVRRARDRELKAEEIQGATFTVSNLGMFGIDHFDAIINPPGSAILAIGRIQKLPVVEEDEIVIGHRMTLTLSCDHRAVDGALGARYMKTLVEMLERPESLAL